MRTALKIVFTVAIVLITIMVLGFSQVVGFTGALPMIIIGLAMFAGIRAVWKYNPKSKETTSDLPTLNKDG
tara:strand:+ start:474 stop:686 length:213 start_codon:yes stop_codon:yes gene_type:complete